ncbi:DUF1016 N-terminal domain-containing protein [Geotalea uraniireducens]|uniref:DUF1016 N-terminal domain-containing protein n=1 Tax=Geotalea uraniireducens TaxID=351604 RepID=UPI00006BC033|nr:DUF1016 N-terminal domain-containing protein [Geotalea uraniireducens]
MIEAYWNVGRMIVEEEQQGMERAGYGKALIRDLSERLTSEFGSGFGVSNLSYFRQFYLSFPIFHAPRGISADCTRTGSRVRGTIRPLVSPSARRKTTRWCSTRC